MLISPVLCLLISLIVGLEATPCPTPAPLPKPTKVQSITIDLRLTLSAGKTQHCSLLDG